ncbi:hypothetical protein FRACYDRAFT_246818 [Fragilariopsis cylindrus CCMP1102]|uniref:Uncharacterized protein n=1 Tax=Fragilariopsis cylindrus CCMP1102 TaxID=635003 RepID=A0A1E7EZH2_9STRA|nr:hypothetical protein FRACYDRAFT_246818 [Fragilariopsis cylindrus CCMP1102]|eukprot:OEU10943.1 hypothetical protein FRACYDRAFT_246818 [Fragilariopsis cylindrus CCMP1102]
MYHQYRPNNLERLYGAQHYTYVYKVQLLLRALGRLGRCQGVLSPKKGHLGPKTSCITPITTFQCEEHIPSTPKSGPGIHPMHIKLRLYHLIGTLYMLGWVRMPESGLVLVASTTGCVLADSSSSSSSSTYNKNLSVTSSSLYSNKVGSSSSSSTDEEEEQRQHRHHHQGH